MNKQSQKTEFEPSQLHNRGNLSPVRPRQKMPTIYRHRIQHKIESHNEDNLKWPRDNSYLKKRLNNEVEKEREEMLIMTGRTSQDNPEWMGVNFDHYKRSGFSRPMRQSIMDQRQLDVFNNPRNIVEGRNEESYFMNMRNSADFSRNHSTFKTSYGSTLRSTLAHSLTFQPQVSSKVGSIDFRDYSIRRPLLKIGRDSKESYVDTYSPF